MVGWFVICPRVFSLTKYFLSWWRHPMETFSALLALCVGNSPVIGEFPLQRPMTLSFGVSFDLYLNKRLSKQSWGWWFATPWWHSLWRHRNGLSILCIQPVQPENSLWWFSCNTNTESCLAEKYFPTVGYEAGSLRSHWHHKMTECTLFGCQLCKQMYARNKEYSEIYSIHRF